MSESDWLAVYFILPCLLFKSTRAAALVLLLVFPFYCLSKFHTDSGMIRYMAFGAQDTVVAMTFLWFAGRNECYKMEGLIALLSSAAVVYHFCAWVAFENDMDRSFYTNACIIIVISQIALLYTRIVVNGRISKDICRRFILRFPSFFNYYNGSQRAKKATTAEGSQKA